MERIEDNQENQDEANYKNDDGMQSEILSDRLSYAERRKYLTGVEMERIEDNQENQDEANYKNNFRTRGRPRVEQQTLNTVKDILKLVKGIESLLVKSTI